MGSPVFTGGFCGPLTGLIHLFMSGQGRGGRRRKNKKRRSAAMRFFRRMKE